MTLALAPWFIRPLLTKDGEKVRELCVKGHALYNSLMDME